MNFDAKLTKEQEELVASLFGMKGCIARPPATEISQQHVAYTVNLLKEAMSSWYNLPSDPDAPDDQHKMAMEYLANYRPRRRGQKKGYR